MKLLFALMMLLLTIGSLFTGSVKSEPEPRRGGYGGGRRGGGFGGHGRRGGFGGRGGFYG